jgi:hypothetical protein
MVGHPKRSLAVGFDQSNLTFGSELTVAHEMQHVGREIFKPLEQRLDRR